MQKNGEGSSETASLEDEAEDVADREPGATELDSEENADDDNAAAATSEEEGESFQPGEFSDREVDATRLYLKEIEYSSLLTPQEEVQYGRLSRQGDPAARRKMIESNLRLVVKISRRY